MSLHVFVFLLVVCLLCLARLGRLDWFHLRPSSSRGRAKRSRLHRLLVPRSPDDCPACRLASASSLGVGLAPGPVRPWREVKSRRGAPKRIDTQGFACPNPTCRYFGIIDDQIHALVGDGKHGRAEQIQTFRCQACRTTFTARRDTPLYRLKTPSRTLSPSCCQRLPKGWILPLQSGFSAFDKPPLPPGSTPAPRFFLSSSWVPVHNIWPIASSIPCDSSWSLVAFRSSPVTASISISML
jgi:hypothetical protein